VFLKLIIIPFIIYFHSFILKTSEQIPVKKTLVNDTLNQKIFNIFALIMKKILFTAIILSSFFVGCKKKEDKPATAQTRTQLLTANNWTVTAFVASTPGEADENMFGLFENCTKDDFIKFNPNFTVVTDEGATKCDPTDPQTETEIWSFGPNESTIIIDGDSQKIENLNATQLKMSTADVVDGKTYTYTITLSKK
jgi:hypothetical protein